MKWELKKQKVESWISKNEHTWIYKEEDIELLRDIILSDLKEIMKKHHSIEWEAACRFAIEIVNDRFGEK